MKRIFLTLLASLSALSAEADHAPYDNTVYLEPNILNAEDPSAFTSLTYMDEFSDEYYGHNCDNEFIDENFYWFEASYSRGQTVDFLISQEFGDAETADGIARIYAPILGQMPYVLREGVVDFVVFAEGDNWCATSGEIYIEHGGYADEVAEGALEESMMHEAVHASLDDNHAGGTPWLSAQENDNMFVSDYAEASPQDEDLAETFTLYYGLIRGRLDQKDAEIARRAISARLGYLAKNFPLGSLSID